MNDPFRMGIVDNIECVVIVNGHSLKYLNCPKTSRDTLRVLRKYVLYPDIYTFI